MSEARPEPAPRSSSSLAPLSSPAFRRVWLAALLSNFGTWMHSVAAAWLMTSLAPAPDMVALVQAASTGPILILSLVAGAVADLVDRRRVIIAAQVAMFATSIAMTVVTWSGGMAPWILLAFTFLIGCGNAFHGPAWQASVSDLVGRASLPAAVALNSINFNIARSVGPAIGGAVVAAAGVVFAFAVNAATYIPMILAFVLWRRPAAADGLPRERLASAMINGVRYVAEAPGIQTVLVRALAFGIGASAIWALLPVVARQQVGAGPLMFGLMLGALGIGAVLAGLILVWLRRRLDGEGIVSLGYLAIGVASVLLGVTTWPPLVFLALILAGLSWVGCLSTFNISVQIAAPNWVKARALAIYQMTAFGGMAVGSWLWGEFATLRTPAVALVIAGLLMLASIGLRHRYRMPAVPGASELSPARAWPESKAVLEFDRMNVPVLARCEYRVAVDRGDEFAASMRAVRRLRRRDGARRWRLWHDVADPERWVESYEVGSWFDHLRLERRQSEADAAVIARAWSFHAGPETPRLEVLALHDPTRIPLADPAPSG
ncbi:MAG: MFS transporter [Alphaproteobacteria bacterium]|nr:MFS transporter [Alphaproteobacteria bacterium]